MKFVMIWELFVLSTILNIDTLVIKKNDNRYIVKFSNELYDKLQKSNKVEEFKKEAINGLKIKNNTTINMRRKEDNGDISLYYDDFSSKERTIKFFISSHQECNVLINDTILYEQNEQSNLVEHMILHNNAEYIDPKGVFSNDINISYFVYNKKLNMFSVYFDNKELKKKYTIEYDYLAVGMIKSEKNSKPAESNNTFLWKILNENGFNQNLKIRLEFYFNIDKLFLNENVKFSHNFTKNIVKFNDIDTLLYTYESSLKPQEVMILQAKFPFYLDSCGTDLITLPMVLFGSVFIIFLILVLYLIVSSMIFDDV